MVVSEGGGRPPPAHLEYTETDRWHAVVPKQCSLGFSTSHAGKGEWPTPLWYPRRFH